MNRVIVLFVMCAVVVLCNCSEDREVVLISKYVVTDSLRNFEYRIKIDSILLIPYPTADSLRELNEGWVIYFICQKATFLDQSVWIYVQNAPLDGRSFQFNKNLNFDSVKAIPVGSVVMIKGDSSYIDLTKIVQIMARTSIVSDNMIEVDTTFSSG